MEKLRQEKKIIADELLASKEKLISLEGLNEKLLAQQVNKKHLSSESFSLLNRNWFRQQCLYDRKYIFQRLGSTESHSHSSDILSSIKDNQVDSLSKQVIKKFPKANN